jgi:hypothetical protein
MEICLLTASATLHTHFVLSWSNEPKRYRSIIFEPQKQPHKNCTEILSCSVFIHGDGQIAPPSVHGKKHSPHLADGPQELLLTSSLPPTPPQFPLSLKSSLPTAHTASWVPNVKISYNRGFWFFSCLSGDTRPLVPDLT